MKTTKLLALLALTALFASCGSDDDGIEYGKKADTTDTSITVSTDITSRLETPEVLTDGTTQCISHTVTVNNKQVVNYELEYVKSKYHSRWVAFRFDGDTRGKSASRSDAWSDDPALPSTLQIGINGFGWDYNRGHICASADRLYSLEANQQTFYMSNMSPQLGNFNQGYWITLEGLVQSLGRDASFADTLYVVKGGTVKDDQIMDYVTRSDYKKVAVPKYYFVALLKVKNNTYSSIAFWMEHKNYTDSKNKEYTNSNQAPISAIKTHAVSVNTLEEYTGINFFPNLNKRSGGKEETIEDQLLPSNWGM